jgi:hypothetical protein
LHLHTCVHIFCTIFTLLPPFPTTSTLFLVPTPSPVLPLFSNFVEEKSKMLHFSFFEIKVINIQKIYLWFSMYIYVL